jgi:hypothetical protein
MNNMTEISNQDLQIQIGEHLADGIRQLHQKLDNMLMAFCNLEMKVEYIFQKVENMNMNMNKTHDDSFDTDSKRKISEIKKERDFQRLLEKEKKLWEKEYMEQEQQLLLARQEWEDNQMQLDKINSSYLS